MNLIEEVINPLKEETVAFAVKRAEDHINNIYKNLEAEDWDINKVYPYPNSRTVLNRFTYMSMLDSHKFALSVTDPDENRQPVCRRIDDPNYRVISEVQRKRHLDMVKKMTEADFDAYVIKLTKKIGLDDVESVVLDENHKHLWDFSILYVTRKDGTKEIWKTMIIVKSSCLGKIFNQWPTRKVKKI